MEVEITGAIRETVKMVYSAVLPVKIINIQLNENYHRDQDLFHLN